MSNKRPEFPYSTLYCSAEAVVLEHKKGTHNHSAMQMACDLWLIATPEQWLRLLVFMKSEGVVVETGLGNRPTKLEEVDYDNI